MAGKVGAVTAGNTETADQVVLDRVFMVLAEARPILGHMGR